MIAWSPIVIWPGQARRVRHNEMSAQTAIVRHVDIGHEKILVADGGHPTALHCRPIDGDILAEDVVISDDDFRGLAFVPQMLRRSTDRDEGMKLAPFTDLGPAVDGHMRQQTRPFAERDMFSDDGKRSDDDIVGETVPSDGQWHWDESARRPPVRLMIGGSSWLS